MRMLNVWVDNLSMTQLMDKLDEGVVSLLLTRTTCTICRVIGTFMMLTGRQTLLPWTASTCTGVLAGLGGISRRRSQVDLVPAYCAYHRNNPAVKVPPRCSGCIAQKALERINARAGREVAVGAHSPSMKFVNDEQEIDEVIHVINSSGATCLIVGLGAPKQEIWITRYRHECRTLRFIWASAL